MDFYSTVSGTTSLHEQNVKLQQNHSGLAESVSSLSKICKDSDEKLRKHAQLNLDLSSKVEKLQLHNSSLKDTVNSLTVSCKATEEKLKLQSQLHNDQVLTMNCKDRTLTERCKSLAALAEQHRLACMRHEEKHKNLSKELQSMAAVVAGEGGNKEELQRLQSSLRSKDKDMLSLQQNIHSLQTNVQTLKQNMQSLKEEHDSKMESVSGRLQAAVKLLKSFPEQQDAKSRIMGSLKSSAEVMQLAHTSGGIDCMRECLGQVSAVLQDLHGQLQGLDRLGSSWHERVEALTSKI